VRKAVPSAALAAAGTFAAGFGTMRVWYSGAEHPPELNGLFAYKAATWGDAILLPTVAGCLAVSISQLAPARREREIAGLAGVFGLAAGAFSQVGWLMDPQPGLNWTLPRPHHFNAAGWYHAAFLSAGSAAFAGASALIVARAAHAPAIPGRVWRSLVAAAAATAAFAGLVIYDNVETRTTTASRATGAAGMAGAMALGALLMIAKRRSRQSLP